ncbi:hypothetical protein AB4332_03980 [Vibrio breoganii]
MDSTPSKRICTKIDHCAYIVNHNITQVFQFEKSFVINLNDGNSFEVLRNEDFRAEDYTSPELDSVHFPVHVEANEYHRIQREIGEYLGIELKDPLFEDIEL